MQKERRSARELALNILYQIDAAGLPMEEALQVALNQSSLEGEARVFAESLVRGTLGKVGEIDERLRGLSPDWPLKRQAAVDRNILRLAAFEIDNVDSVPDVVSINEAVEMAKKFSTAESGKFINGVLAAYLRLPKTKTEVEKVDSADS
ncbi:MAG: transcription antitermination factor NusB [Armatimonadota bacterium]|nr:transcription antitermination factor NusB [Armatimonadota bacterium]